MNDLRGDAALEAEQLEACRRVIGSGWYVLGREVEAFEKAWAARCEVAHAVGVGNGMDAIEIGLRAVGVGKGDEVVTTGMTAFATVLAILRAGATPVLADIRAEDAMLDPDSVRRCLTPRTRAVVLVHLYGQVGPAEELAELCRDNDLVLVEDCAQAHLARTDRGPAGSFGRFAAWSFYPTKNLGALGDGGALTTDDPAIDEAARKLRNYGQSVRYVHDRIGLNSRLDELQAALLGVRLRRLEAWTARRRQIAQRYHAGLEGSSVRPLRQRADAEAHVHHLFVVLSDQRAALQTHLESRGVQSLVHYPVPVHLQDPCRDLARDPDGLTVTERHAGACFSLPCHPGLSDADVDAVIDAVRSFAP